MAQTSVNIRMDEATKVAFDRFCNEIGLSMSAAFNVFAKTVVREQRIPFELTTEIPNAVTLAAMDAAEKDGEPICQRYAEKRHAGDRQPAAHRLPPVPDVRAAGYRGGLSGEEPHDRGTHAAAL